jgi:hypothetical protein
LSVADYVEAALFEHRFWLQIFGDHARFISQYLPRNAAKEMQQAFQFIQIFDRLLQESRRDISREELSALNQESKKYTQQLRAFKLYLIRQHLTGHIHTQPTLLNHMVNEADEYLAILSFLLSEQVPPILPPIHHHLLWLSDSAVHASGIQGTLDMVEQPLRKKSQTFTRHFQDLYLKAVELAGFMRASLTQFPALTLFNREAELEMRLFREFLDEIQRLGLSAELLGSLSPLITDHMAREACYYLFKLANATGSLFPACDPTNPRPRT